MCGIAGIYNYRSASGTSATDSVKKMLTNIRHRGPDECGMYVGNNVTLGNVRLSIVDLASGQQPMCDESGNYWIVYNGEIFNHAELRVEIEKKGIRLKTKCDTEVVVQMYALYGKDCLSYFNGQFAFCIWNKKDNELFFARDRVGIRPLYYWKQNDSFAFCSEIKGLYALDGISRALRPQSLAQIFTFWTTVSPYTPFENVYELPPGHYMRVNASGMTIDKYWSLDFGNANENSISIDEATEEFGSLLKDAVRIRLRADVPVAAYLSGGLDSSITTALIHEVNPDMLHTFSIGFQDTQFDETEYQKEAAAYFNSNHTAFHCTAPDIANNFADTIWHTEFPILRTAPTPMYMLSNKVHERNIKVVMTGEGADEFLGGYNIFKEAKIRRFWAAQPKSAIRPLLLSRLYPYLPALKDANPLAFKMFFGYKLTETDNPLYSHLLRWHNTSRIKSFFSDEMNQALSDYSPLDEIYAKLPAGFNDWTGLAKSQYLEASVFMSGYLLSSQGDRMAMAHSVEGRYPFLDYRVIEYSNKLPDRFKLNGLNEKFILKKVSKGKVPASITKRTKQPYRAPIAASFFHKNAPGYIGDILSVEMLNAFGIFNPVKVQSLIKKITLEKNISEVDQMAIAGILSTQLTHKMFITNPVTAPTSSLHNIKIVTD